MASDSVRLICPNLKCRAILSVPGQARGKTVRCRQCGMRVQIPNRPTAAPPKPSEADEPNSTPAA